MLGLKLFSLEFEIDQAIEAAMEKQQIDLKIAPAHLDGIVAADEAKIAAQFDEEVLRVARPGRDANQLLNGLCAEASEVNSTK